MNTNPMDRSGEAVQYICISYTTRNTANPVMHSWHVCLCAYVCAFSSTQSFSLQSCLVLGVYFSSIKSKSNASCQPKPFPTLCVHHAVNQCFPTYNYTREYINLYFSQKINI